MARFIRKSASKAYASGKQQFDMSFLPPKAAIDAAFIVMSGALNVPAAGITAAQQRRLVDSVECERRFRSSGLGLAALTRVVRGCDKTATADIATGAAQAIDLAWPITFRDPRGEEATDAPPATDFYVGKTLDVYMAKATDILAALAVNAGTEIYLEFHLSPLSPGKVPVSQLVNFVEVTGKEVVLPAGDILDLVLVKNDGTAITAAELGNVKLQLDGATNLLERETLATLLRSYNEHIAAGVGAGEAIAPASATLVPLYHPVPPYKGTKLARSNERAVFSFDGTLAANVARIFYRMNEVRSHDAALAGGRKIWGFGRSVVAKTASKNGVSEARGFLSGIAARLVR